MKTLKILVFFIMLVSQSAIAQTADNIDKTKTTKNELFNKPAGNNNIILSIPMIGNLAINNADEELRQATRPLNVNSNYSRSEMISESKIDKEHSASDSKGLLGK
jgi:hypothetical protein